MKGNAIKKQDLKEITLEIDANLFYCVEEKAKQAGCSTDEMLIRLIEVGAGHFITTL